MPNHTTTESWVELLQVGGDAACRDEVDACLNRIAEQPEEGRKIFVQLTPDAARAVAHANDSLRQHGPPVSRVAGMPIAVKDLLDVEGQVTGAGSKVLKDGPRAQVDAPAVRRLKEAGAALVGRTNMTPFAYSLVGLNADYGTPRNPWDPSRIPGGSSSGSAVAVARGMATAAIGSDTAGSIRVPAALCGCVGFKPTQATIPLEGCVPLAATLDSLGPLARSVAICGDVFGTLSGRSRTSQMQRLEGVRLALPNQLFIDDFDASVASAFGRALSAVSRAGARLPGTDAAPLVEGYRDDLHRVIQATEAYAWHRDLLRSHRERYDPRIRTRIEAGADISAADYLAALAQRSKLMEAYERSAQTYDFLIFPTVPFIAPTFAESEADETRVRSLLLRNASGVNLLDLCAVSIPMQEPGTAPVGLQVIGRQGDDWRLLGVAAAIESALSY